MSGLVGKGVRSYKKAIVSDSNFPALGFTNFIMAFQNASDQVGPFTVDLTSVLTVPAEMVAAGFQQPDPITIVNAQLGTFRNNVVVTSNLNGVLIDRISYTLTNDSITFDDGLNSNEIIVIKRGNEAVTGNRIVDARPLRASGDIDFSTIGSAPVIFEVGEGFRIAPSTTATGGIDNRQIGFVQVFVDGVLQARNVGNENESMLPASEQSGNYREVIVDGLGNLLAVQNGVTANAIEFNQFQPFSSMEGVIVISTNLIVDSPNSTGVIDAVDALGARVTGTETELNRIPTPVNATPADILQVNSGGTAYELVTPSSGGSGVIQVDTYETASGSFDYVVPADTTALRITASGGGAPGSGASAIAADTNAPGGVGGNAGQYDVRYIPVTGSGQTLSVVIGGPNVDTSISGTGITTSTFTAGGGEGGSGGGTTIRGTVGNPVDYRINSRDGGSAGAGSGRAGGGGSGGNNPRAIGGSGGNALSGNFGSAGPGGGGGGAGWVDGSPGTSTSGNSTGGAGGRGGMVIEALGITVNVN